MKFRKKLENKKKQQRKKIWIEGERQWENHKERKMPILIKNRHGAIAKFLYCSLTWTGHHGQDLQE